MKKRLKYKHPHFLLIRLILFCMLINAISFGSENGNGYFYYYNNEPIQLDTAKDVIAICFSEQVTERQKNDLIRADSSLKDISNEKLPYGLVLANTNNNVNNKETIRRQNNLSQVKYSTPVLKYENLKLIMTDKFIVRFNENVTEKEIDIINKANNVEIVRKSPYRNNRYVLRLFNPQSTTSIEMANVYHDNPNVKYATPEFIVLGGYQNTTPNDTYYYQQWNLHNTGQNPPGGTLDADIDAPEGWDISTGSSDIVIAIIDSGVDINHQDLNDKIVYPYDFIGNDNDPTSTNPHGTACAGLAAAESNNSQGVAGVAWNCKIMPLCIGESNPVTTAAIEAIDYAVDNGAHVLSCSWSASPDDDLTDAISSAISAGCVIVCASGNDYSSSVNYPANLPYVIAVGATDADDERWDYSNYGHALGVVAPSGDHDGVSGTTILWTTDISDSGGYNSGSTSDGDLAGNYTKWYSGTSAATPQVAGLAALILSIDSSLTPTEVKYIIESSCDDLGNPGWDEEIGWGRINVYNALTTVNNFSMDILENWWEFDENDGSTAYDSIGYNHGTISGATWTSGKTGYALDFDGSDDYVGIGPTYLMAGQNVTISAWIKTDKISSPSKPILYQPIVMQNYYDGDEQGYMGFSLNLKNAYPTFTLIAGDPGAVSSIAIETGKWYHIMGIYDGSSLKIYINGTLAGEEELSQGIGVYCSAYIGSDYEGYDHFDGVIDDVYICNYALTPYEIYSLIYPSASSVFVIKNSSIENEDVAMFDNYGNLLLKGTFSCDPSLSVTPNDEDEFVILNPSGSNVLTVINTSTGDMAIRGALYYLQTNQAYMNTYAHYFIVKDSYGDVKAFIDNYGYMRLMGRVYEGCLP